jgi:hypothetical protein
MFNGGIFWASQAGSGDLEDRVINLENTEHEYEVYELITSGTSGTVTLSAHSTIVLDQYEGLADCLIVQVDPIGQRPIDAAALDTNGQAITADFDSNGNWEFTNEAPPVGYPMAIVYQIKLAELWKSTELPNDKIVNESEVLQAWKVAYDKNNANLTSLTVQDAIDEIQNLNPAIQFNTLNTTQPNEGQVNWNSDEGTMQIGMPGGKVTLNLGQEMYVPRRVKNNTASNMVNGQIVYISGGDGNNAYISLAQANTEITSADTVAMLTEDIAAGQKGFATIFGIVRGDVAEPLNTSAYAPGTSLYLS